MKKGFGVFFIIIGILNFIIGIIGLSTIYKTEAIGKIIFALVVLPLGIWMYESSKPKIEEKKFELKSHKLKSIKKKNKKLKKKKDKIEAKFDLLNSVEYIQLKNLFDTGILTKEEFDSKVELIKKSNNGDRK